MTVAIESTVGVCVDRDGTGNDQGRQGFDVTFFESCGEIAGRLHFEDEDTAERMARAILLRLGVVVPPVIVEGQP